MVIGMIKEYGIECQQVVSLSQSICVSPFEFTDGRGGGGGAKSYACEKAWSSINNSIHSGQDGKAVRLVSHFKSRYYFYLTYQQN